MPLFLRTVGMYWIINTKQQFTFIKYNIYYSFHYTFVTVCSLSALADVLGALSENRSHIPYRNTKLTHVLQDTIGKSLLTSLHNFCALY